MVHIKIFRHLASPVTLRLAWNLRRNDAPVLARSRQVTRGLLDTGVLWDHIRYVPKKAGTYTLEVDVAMGSLSAARSITFRVTR